MSISVITGSQGQGTFFGMKNQSPMDQNLINIVGAIETLNDPAVVVALQGQGFLDTFIRNVEGIQGHTEGWKEYKVFVTDDGSYQDGETYEAEYYTWSFFRKGYIVKDKDFSHALMERAYEEGTPLSQIVNERIDYIRKMYAEEYLPKVAYETLFILPKATGGNYTDNFGFLRDVVVDQSMLVPHVDHEEPRNHYRAIEGSEVTAEDIEWVVEYMSDYRDVSDSQIVAIGTRGTLSKLKNTLEYEGNRDEFARTGQPADEISGVRFIKNDFMPRGMILFVAGEATHLITKLVSPKEDRRGIAIVKEEGFTHFESMSDLTNSFFKILPEGYHLTGRHFGLFLDLENSGGAERKMQQAGFDKLVAHARQLRSGWYRGLR